MDGRQKTRAIDMQTVLDRILDRQDPEIKDQIDRATEVINNQIKGMSHVVDIVDFSCVRHGFNRNILPFLRERFSLAGWKVEDFASPGNDFGLVIAWPDEVVKEHSR